MKDVRWRLLAPGKAVDDLGLKAISVERFGSGPGHLWEQGPLFWRSRRDTLIGFGGKALRGLFAKPGAWRVLDGAIAVMMFVLAAGLVRG